MELYVSIFETMLLVLGMYGGQLMTAMAKGDLKFKKNQYKILQILSISTYLNEFESGGWYGEGC